jgi:hypothetical protein
LFILLHRGKGREKYPPGIPDFFNEPLNDVKETIKKTIIRVDLFSHLLFPIHRLEDH